MSILTNFSRYLTASHWNIGFVEEDIHEVLHASRLNIRWMRHGYKDRWFADPFLLDVNDREIVVLVEEFAYDNGRGRIAKLVVDRKDYTLKGMKVILDLDTHLSFPFIYRRGADIFLMPENCKSDSTKMYRYAPATDRLEKVSDVSRLPLADATIVGRSDGGECILSTQEPYQNKDRLQVYRFDAESMTADEKPLQDIRFKSNIARNAGAMFEVDGVSYRPAQDCNKCYGNGVVIQRVDDDGRTLRMTDVKAFHSDYPEMDMGYHTFNMRNGLIVVDGHGHDHPWGYKLQRLLSKAKHLIK